MSERVIVLIVPGLRERDLEHMPALRDLAVDTAPLAPSFPSVSPVVQTCMTTGLQPQDHGIVSSHKFERDSQELNERSEIVISAEPIWTTIRGFNRNLRCSLIGLCPFAVPGNAAKEFDWLMQHPSTTTAESVAHEFKSSLQSGDQLICARLAHLDGPGHRHGPESPEFLASRDQLNREVSDLVHQAAECASAVGDPSPLWIVASEYVINPVNKVIRPNALLQAAGYKRESDRQGECKAWAVSDSQAAHIFLSGPTSDEIAQVFGGVEGIAQVLNDTTKVHRDLNHPDVGDLVLVAEPDATFVDAEDDAETLQRKGTHGAPAETLTERGVILASEPGVLLGSATMSDFDLAGLVLRQFGI